MKEIRELFQKSQENISTHQKLIQRLRTIYRSNNSHQEISRGITECTDILFCQDYRTNKERHTRSITFVAHFILDLLTEDSDEENENALVRAVVDRALQHIDTVNVNCRYHSVQLLDTILKNIRTDIKVSEQLCEDIQYHLIDRFMTDAILPIRVLSGSALVKLQNIDNPRCSVMEAYARMCNDASPMIRKLAVMHLAITHSSYETLIGLMCDMDVGVRLQAYKRVSAINPTCLRILQRQQVIINGIDEEQISVRKIFFNTLLPKWLQMYDNDLLSFYNSVRLDAQLNDIEETRTIHDELMKIFFKCFSPSEIVKYLPIGGNSLVSVEQLTSEVSAYWYYFILNLQKEENCDVEVESVLPQLTPFCEYIKSVIKSKEGLHLEEWENLQFQEVLYNLFRMVSISDLADEVGRQNLQPFIKETLVNTKLDKPVIGEVLEIYKMFIPGIECQCEELCSIISEIRECIHANEDECMELTTSQKIELQHLRAKVYILEASVDKAVEEKQFLEAEKLHHEIEDVQKRMEQMKASQIVRQPVREIKKDSETMCRCLDILTVFLRNTKLQKLPSSLRVCLNEFVKPGMKMEDINIHGRIFQILGQFCILDKAIAMEDAQYICSPLISTKYGRYDRSSILSSVQAISDIVRAHGPDILGDDDDESLSVTSINSSKSRRRRLYQEQVHSDDIVAQCMNMSRGLIMDIMLDLLDEEDDEVRHTASMALMKLVMNGLLVNSSLLTRLMLKWLNPFTEKHDPKMQQIIGNGLLKYALNIENSGMVIQRTIVPTLNCIGNAPENSPFQDVELDHVLHSLCNMTKVQRTGISNIHKSVALEIVRTIKNRPKAKSTFTLSKFLLILEPLIDKDENFVSDSIDEVDVASQYLTDTRVVKLLTKYKALLTKLNTTSNSAAIVEHTMNGDMANQSTEDSHQTSKRRNKENENPERTDQVWNRNNSSNTTLQNDVIDDSQSSMESTTSLVRQEVQRIKPSGLYVIIERSSEPLSSSRDSTPSPEEASVSKRKRSRRPVNEDASLSPNVNNGHKSPQSSALTRSTRKLRVKTATPSLSSSSVSLSSTSTTVSTRSSRKTQKRGHNISLEAGEEITPRRSTRKRGKKIT